MFSIETINKKVFLNYNIYKYNLVFRDSQTHLRNFLKY